MKTKGEKANAKNQNGLSVGRPLQIWQLVSLLIFSIHQAVSLFIMAVSMVLSGWINEDLLIYSEFGG